MIFFFASPNISCLNKSNCLLASVCEAPDQNKIGGSFSMNFPPFEHSLMSGPFSFEVEMERRVVISLPFYR